MEGRGMRMDRVLFGHSSSYRTPSRLDSSLYRPGFLILITLETTNTTFNSITPHTRRQMAETGRGRMQVGAPFLIATAGPLDCRNYCCNSLTQYPEPEAPTSKAELDQMFHVLMV